ncbi:glycoside hydrolase family 127 protein, partial [Balneolaceae bacterium ANBcel3]|nr:glycoside hydrolase family 127 protein [Balneolaceae bacterium ANBcel3]
REGPETCNTYNMMKLSRQLFLTSGNVRYIDYYERAMYNHILSSQHPGHGGLVYFTPMRPGHYRVYSNPEKTFWCCVGSGIENHTKYGELIYAHSSNGLYVNLFVPSKVDWKDKGLALVQETTYPESEQSMLTLSLDQSQRFDINVRHPQWLADGEMIIEINGESIPSESQSGSYMRINRMWSDGDQIRVHLPMSTYGEYMPDGSPYMAILHGPLVMAAPTTTDHTEGLIADDSRMGQVSPGILYPRSAMPMLVIDDDRWMERVQRNSSQPLSLDISEILYPSDEGKELQLVPFYQVHDTRYILYWQTGTKEEVKHMREELAEKEGALMDMENQTIARVRPGQQQPESEHNFQGENTSTGVLMNQHWRQSTNWFSYDMNDPGREARVLRLIYYGGDANRHFHIYFNDNHLAEVRLDGSDENRFSERSYALPVWVVDGREDGIHTVRFEAVEGSTTGRIADVRILR